MKKTKKLVSILMTLVMAFGCLAFAPSAAFAGDAYQGEPGGTADTGTVPISSGEGEPGGAAGDGDGDTPINGTVPMSASALEETNDSDTAGVLGDIMPFAADVGTAAALKAAIESKETPIRLTANINYPGGIVIDGWDLDLFMNGYNLNIVNSGGTGLTIRNGCMDYYNYFGASGAGGNNITITGKGRGVYVDNGALRKTGSTPYADMNVTLSGALGGIAEAVSVVNCNDYVEINNINAGSTKNSRGIVAVKSIVSCSGSITLTGAGSIGVYANKISNVAVDGDINAVSRGVFVADISYVVARDVTVTGKGGIGVYTTGYGSSAEVNDVRATGAGSVGLYLSGTVSATSARDVMAVGKGVYCAGGYGQVQSVSVSGKNSVGIHVVGYADNDATCVYVSNNVEATGAGSTGVLSQLGARVDIYGNVSAGARGVTVHDGGRNTRIYIENNVTVSEAGGIGLEAIGSGVCDYKSDYPSGGIFDIKGQNGVGIKADGTKVEAEVAVNGTGAGVTGVHVTNKGEVRLAGINTGANYVKLGTKVKAKADNNSPSTRSGYLTYTDGGNTVWVAREYTGGMWVTVSSAAEFAAALLNTRTEGHADYEKGIRLMQNFTIPAATDIDIKNIDLLLDLQAYTLTVGGVLMENASLELRGTTGAFAITSRGVALNNSVLTTPVGPSPANQASVNIAGGFDLLEATNGSVVDIKGNLSNSTLNGGGLVAKSGSRVKLSGNVNTPCAGIDASGEGTVVEVTGNVASQGTGGSWDGVLAANKAEVTVGGSVTSARGKGVNAGSGARVTVKKGGTGAVVAPAYGVYAEGKGTSVTINGEIGTGSVIPDYAVYAEGGAYVSVSAAYVYSKDYGAYAAGKGTVVRVKTGNYVGALEPYGIAACAVGGSEIYVEGDLFADNANGTGARAESGGTITVDGVIRDTVAPNPTYIVTNSVLKRKGDYEKIFPKPGYLSYIEKSGIFVSTVHVKVSDQFDCRIGNKYYENFRAAWDALKHGDTLTLMRDVNYSYTNTDNALVLSGKNVTVDVADHDLQINYSGSNGHGLEISAGAKLVFDGYGGSKVGISSNGSTPVSLWVYNASLAMSDRFINSGNTLDVTGNAYGLQVYRGSATVTSVKGPNFVVVYAEDYGVVDVLGDVESGLIGTYATGIHTGDNSKVTVGGNVRGKDRGIDMIGRNSIVDVSGNVAGGSKGVSASGPANSVSVAGNVTVDSETGAGLYVYSGSSAYVGGNVSGGSHGINAEDPGSRAIVNGSASGGLYGVLVRDGAKAWAGSVAVSSIAMSGTTFGVFSSDGGEIFIAGDVINSAIGTIRYGALVERGGEVTISGTITGWTTYIQVGGENKTIAQYETPTTKKGYYTFTDSNSVTGTKTNTVWLKDGVTIPGSTTPAYLPKAYTKTYYRASLKAAGLVTSWSLVSGALPDGLDLYSNYITGYPTTPGSYTFSLAVTNGSNVSDPVEFTLVVEPSDPVSVSISPSHAILTNTTDTVTFTVDLKTPNVNYDEVFWSFNGNANTNIGVIGGGYGKSYTIRATVINGPDTVKVYAEYNNGVEWFSAIATVEILPDGAAGVTTAKVLETKVTVNKAKVKGALVPVLITNQNPQSIGVMSTGPVAPPDTGSTVISEVRLVQYDSKTKAWDKIVPGYTASMHAADNRHIEINADQTAKAASKVKVMLRSHHSSAYIDAGTINLAVTEKWPKVTVKAGQPNIMFPDRPAALTVTSPDGACTVHSVKAAKGADDGKVFHAQSKLYTDPEKMKHKAGTVSTIVNVSVAGYKPLKTMPKVNVKVVKAQPKIKLSQTSVTLTPRMIGTVTNYDVAVIQLLSADKKVPFESGYKISGVYGVDYDAAGKTLKKYADVNVEYDNKTGIITVNPLITSSSGTQMLEVWMDEGRYCVYLPLKVTVLSEANMSKITATSSVKTITVNTAHSDLPPQNFIANIPISVSAGNYIPNDWEIYVGSVADGVKMSSSLFSGVITPSGTGNNIVLSNNNSIALNNLVALAPGKTKSWTLNIVSPTLNLLNKNAKPVQVKLTITGKTHTATVKVSGKLDVANPQSKMTGTLKFANTMSEAAEIRLWDMKMLEESKDYDIVLTGKNKFEIKIKQGREINAMSGGPKQFNVFYDLKDGTGGNGSKLIKIMPTQTKGKAWQSRKAVTLYTSQPKQSSESIEIRFTAPANVTLEAIRINEASLAACKFTDGKFLLSQVGENDYVIRFYNENVPKVIAKNGKAGKLKSGYTIKLELWAAGTYQYDWNGNPTALGYYDAKGKWIAKTKPTIVNVKVNLKQ